MKKIFIVITILLLLATASGAQDSPEYRLMKSVLSDDINGVESAIAEGANVNAPFVVHGVGFGPYDTPLSELEFDVIDPERFVMAGNMNAEVWPALKGACESGNPDIARILIRAGADANYNWGEFLSQAIDEGNNALLAALLEDSLDEKSRSSAWFSAFEASKDRDIGNVINLLIDAGFDPNAVVKRDKTPLQMAREAGCGPSVIDLLKSRGATTPFDSPLLGSWLFPDMDGSPGHNAKMTYRDDGTGLIYDRMDDTEPMKGFTYEFAARDEGNGLYHIIQTYSQTEYYRALVYIEEVDGTRVLHWASHGRLVDVFPNFGQRVSLYWKGTIAGE